MTTITWVFWKWLCSSLTASSSRSSEHLIFWNGTVHCLCTHYVEWRAHSVHLPWLFPMFHKDGSTVIHKCIYFRVMLRNWETIMQVTSCNSSSAVSISLMKKSCFQKTIRKKRSMKVRRVYMREWLCAQLSANGGGLQHQSNFLAFALNPTSLHILL